MNREQFAGICRQFSGKINEAWGELAGNPQRATAGRQSQIAGKTQQRNGLSNEESARQLREFLHRNRKWNFHKERENA